MSDDFGDLELMQTPPTVNSRISSTATKEVASSVSATKEVAVKAEKKYGLTAKQAKKLESKASQMVKNAAKKLSVKTPTPTLSQQKATASLKKAAAKAKSAARLTKHNTNKALEHGIGTQSSVKSLKAMEHAATKASKAVVKAVHAVVKSHEKKPSLYAMQTALFSTLEEQDAPPLEELDDAIADETNMDVTMPEDESDSPSSMVDLLD